MLALTSIFFYPIYLCVEKIDWTVTVVKDSAKV
jgi:hypothetical protein